MKQSRRQELKTNELSIFLQQAYAAASRNVNYIIGGLVAVVLILVAVLYIQHRRSEAREQAWNTYYELQGKSANPTPETLDEARGFAAEMRDHQGLGTRVDALVADMAYGRSMNISPTSNKEEKLKLLKEARDRYKAVIANSAGEHPAMVARARLGLAAAEESLVLAGEGSRETIREQYESLVKGELGLYSELAADLLDSLDNRLQPVKIVATRPAEPPATAPTARPAATQTAEAEETDQPGASTQPASDSPAPAETEPES